MTIFGQDVTAISKSIVSKETDRGGFIYSVGISVGERIFEDYRLLANYIIDSMGYY